MRYLINVVETYRVGSEEEAKQLIEEAKKDKNYSLVKYTSQQKNKKLKGEIVEEWTRVTLTKEFTDEKEPDFGTSISYNAGSWGSVASGLEEEDE